MIHELNNLFNVALGNMEMIEERLERDSDARRRARQAIGAILEATEVLLRLRASLPCQEAESGADAQPQSRRPVEERR